MNPTESRARASRDFHDQNLNSAGKFNGKCSEVGIPLERIVDPSSSSSLSSPSLFLSLSRCLNVRKNRYGRQPDARASPDLNLTLKGEKERKREKEREREREREREGEAEALKWNTGYDIRRARTDLQISRRLAGRGVARAEAPGSFCNSSCPGFIIQ